ncbi:hypothetical protein I4U23_016296 [Adineta vaga]|nr:hypothetical protein I4U23_016296 [Adineta vaga]
MLIANSVVSQIDIYSSLNNEIFSKHFHYSTSAAVADLNSDHHLDIVVVNSDTKNYSLMVMGV